MILPLLLFAAAACAAEPVRTAWIVHPSIVNSSTGAVESLRRVLPEVHSVVVTEDFVDVRSAGISLYDLGLLQNPVRPANAVRQLRFRIPRHPEKDERGQRGLPETAIGVFVSGVPIPNHFAAASWQGRNLWHYDVVAMNDNGQVTHAGRPRVGLEAPPPPTLLANLLADGTRHSPLIGFALDGYPIYGPWGFGASGEIKRMRTGYRVRSIAKRTSWPDGTVLTPAQYGPDVSDASPLGTFAEDYEFVPGAGDLDESNGRFAKTPEYPEGTYAYFLATDEVGRLAFPYLIGDRFYGRVTHTGREGPVEVSRDRMTFRVGEAPAAGKELRLRFEFPYRALEWVHEKPVHLLIVSADLAEFDHIHPERTDGGRFEVNYTFRHGGRYRLYADFTPPGRPQRVEAIDLDVAGPRRQQAGLVERGWTGSAGNLRVAVEANGPVRAGADVVFTVRLSGSTALEPYLGAWGHFVLIDESLAHFIHAHPLEGGAVKEAEFHVHGASEASGPPPKEVRFPAMFPRASVYKLWAQFQVSGEGRVVPFVLRVAEPAPVMASPVTKSGDEWPEDAVRVRVDGEGFTPARIETVAGRGLKLVVSRSSEPNCGSRIVFSKLGISRDLAPGATVLIDLPPLERGELRFACGMGMYKGIVVAR